MKVNRLGMIGLCIFGLVALAACGGTAPSPIPTQVAPPPASTAAPTAAPAAVRDPTPASVPTVTPDPTPAPEPTAKAAAGIPLGETHEITGFGFSIDHPTGWLADTRDTITVISELESDHLPSFTGQTRRRDGFGVSLDHRTLGFMSGLGLPLSPTLEDLLQLNARFLNWEGPVEPIEAVVFGVPALKVATQDSSGNAGVIYMGFVGSEAFLLSVEAPSEEALAETMPTWTRMLETISSSSSMSVFLRVIAALDEPRGYCLDIPGHAAGVRLDSPLQVHTCKHGIWNEDGRFDQAGLANGVLRMPHYELCLEAGSASNGAKLILAECNEGQLQTWAQQDSGEFALRAHPQWCITAGEGPSRDAGGPQYLIRGVGLNTCAEESSDRQQWSTVIPR